MKWFDLRRKNILHYGASHYGQEYLSDPMPRIWQDLKTSGLDLQQIQGKKLIVDFRAEGQCDITAAKFIECLQSLPVSDIMVVYNTVVNTAALSYRAVSHPTYLANFAGWFDRMLNSPRIDWIDSKFLCLMRRPSVSRAKLASQLRLLDHVRMSFGSMSTANTLGDYRSWLPDSCLPMLIDGQITRDNGREHDQAWPVFKQCLVNVVAESSSQSDPGVWRSQFISEKTFKAFGLRQIPIWWAVPGLVHNVRLLGFDLFDDLVDHGYDQEPDETARLELAMAQIQKFAQMSLAQCNELKRSLIPRFNKNFDLVKTFAAQCDQWYNRLEQDFDDH